MRRSVFSVGFALIMPLLVMSMLPGTAFAATSSVSYTAVVVPHKYQGSTIHVDLAHPTPAPHWITGTSGKTSPTIALWQEGCSNNVSYFIWFNVSGQWRDTFTTYADGLRATLFYMWCPRWPGDGVGLNFTGATISSTGGANDVDIGSSIGGVVPQPLSGTIIIEGAYTYDHRWFASDGLPPGTSVWIAPGSSYTDWSLPLNGAGTHIGCFIGYMPDPINVLTVCTPYPA